MVPGAQLTYSQAPIEMCRGLGPNCSKTTMWEIKPQCHENTNKEWVTLQHCCQTLELPTPYQTQPLKPSRSSRASVCNLSVSSPSGCWRPAPRRVAVSIVAVNAEENNWHALAECKHSEVVSERRRCVAAVHKLVAAMDVSIYRLFRQPLRSEVLSFEWKTSGNRCKCVRYTCPNEYPMRLRNLDGKKEIPFFPSLGGIQQ